MQLCIPKQQAGVRIERATDVVAIRTQETDFYSDNGGNIPGKKIEPMVCTAT